MPRKESRLFPAFIRREKKYNNEMRGANPQGNKQQPNQDTRREGDKY